MQQKSIQTLKPGRNDPCPCGSGKKYKKCCIDKEESSTTRERQLSRHCPERNDTIWTFKIECVGGAYWKEECIRTIELEANASLFSFHWAINDAVGFDDDHLWEFYAGRNRRNRKVRFAQEYDWEERAETFQNVFLSNIYPLGKGLKLYYFFDYGDNWTFEIRRLRQTKQRDTSVKYPRVMDPIGPNPEQYPTFPE